MKLEYWEVYVNSRLIERQTFPSVPLLSVECQPEPLSSGSVIGLMLWLNVTDDLVEAFPPALSASVGRSSLVERGIYEK